METIYLNHKNLVYWQQKAKRSVMALGFFDGIHMGHREVIKTGYQLSKKRNLSLSVMSFFPHPKTVLSNGKKRVDYLMPLSDKEKLFNELGVDTFYIVEFDREFSSLWPEQFVKKYLIGLGVIHAVAGFDYTYGFQGAGNMERLKRDSRNILEVTKVPKVECVGEKISSTCIREKLSKGNVDELPNFLGRHYEVEGKWDGNSFVVGPYYTLPAAGRYAVNLKGIKTSQELEIIVTEKKTLIPIKTSMDFLLTTNEIYTIIWERRIFEKKLPFFKNNWIDTSLSLEVRSK